MADTTVRIYGESSVRAETTITLADRPAVLVVEATYPIDLDRLDVTLQTPDGIHRESLTYEGYSLAGDDGPDIECGCIDLREALEQALQDVPGALAS